MNVLQNIVNLISLRDNLNSILNGYGKLSKDDKTNTQNKINLFDKVILEQSLKLDISNFEEKEIPITRGFTVSSTEDTETVMKKFMQKKINNTTDVNSPILPNQTDDKIVSGPNIYEYKGISYVYKEPVIITQQTVDTAKPPIDLCGKNIGSIVTTEPVISHNDVISTTGYKYPIQTDEAK